jgi:hypothetical protein
VNVAIGLNTNDVSRIVAEQQEEITALKAEILQLQIERIKTNEVLAQLVPGFKNAIEKGTNPVPQTAPSIQKQLLQQTPKIESTKPVTVIVTREHIEKSIALMEKNMQERGIEIANHPIFSRMQTDPVYKEEMISKVMELVRMNGAGETDDKK